MTRPADPDDPRSPKLKAIERGVEERLRELAESGGLAGLPGEGKPFPRDPTDAAGDRWAAFHVMGNERVLPAWAELRHEIDRQEAQLVQRARRHVAWLRARDEQLRSLPAERIVAARRQTAESDERVRAEIAAGLVELNRLVERLDVIVPVPTLQMPRVTIGKVFAAADRAG